MRCSLDVTTGPSTGMLLPARKRVGHAELFFIPDVSQVPVSVFDHPELNDFAYMLYGSPLETLVKYQEDNENNNLVVVSSMNIVPEFRGQKLSYPIMDSIRLVWGRGSSLIAINASPELEGTGPEADSQYAAGREALGKHWEKYGFGHVGGGLMMARSRSDAFLESAAIW